MRNLPILEKEDQEAAFFNRKNEKSDFRFPDSEEFFSLDKDHQLIPGQLSFTKSSATYANNKNRKILNVLGINQPFLAKENFTIDLNHLIGSSYHNLEKNTIELSIYISPLKDEGCFSKSKKRTNLVNNFQKLFELLVLDEKNISQRL